MKNFWIAENSLLEENVQVGADTKIWYWVHIMSGTKIGQNCNIGDRVFIGKNVIIGDNVRIANGVNIYEGTVIKDRVFLGNNVSFTNVRYPRAWRKANQFMATVIEEDATVNANAVITAGVRVGRGATVGDGAIVVNNVSDGGMVVSPKAECICEREECTECSKRKERNLRKHIKYGKA